MGCSTLRDLVGGSWEVSRVEQDPAVLYLHLKNSGSSEVFYVASRLDPRLMKALTRSPEGFYYLPMERQTHLEGAIDDACAEIQKGKHIYPGLPLVEVAARFPGLSNNVTKFRTPFKAGEMIEYGALYSRIRYPANGSDVTVTDAVASCRDPSGERFATAQQRAALEFVVAAEDFMVLALKRINKEFDRKSSKSALEMKQSDLNFGASQIRWTRFELAERRAELEWLAKHPDAIEFEHQEWWQNQATKFAKSLSELEVDFYKRAKAFGLPPEQFLLPEQRTLIDKDFELLFPVR